MKKTCFWKHSPVEQKCKRDVRKRDAIKASIPANGPGDWQWINLKKSPKEIKTGSCEHEKTKRNTKKTWKTCFPEKINTFSSTYLAIGDSQLWGILPARKHGSDARIEVVAVGLGCGPWVMAHIHTYGWVKVHVWMNHGTHMMETRVQRINRGCGSWSWLLPLSHGTNMNESWYTYEWDMVHERVMAHVWTSHGTDMDESLQTYG